MHRNKLSELSDTTWKIVQFYRPLVNIVKVNQSSWKSLNCTLCVISWLYMTLSHRSGHFLKHFIFDQKLILCSKFVVFHVFRKHTKSPPIELKITESHTLRHFLILYDTFGTIRTLFGKVDCWPKNDHFVQVTVQCLAQGLRALRPIPHLIIVIGRSFQGLP